MVTAQSVEEIRNAFQKKQEEDRITLERQVDEVNLKKESYTSKAR